ncbi:hypothetical protein CBOM_08017 [Ceraceosorus bombacis]|uniref:Uncharacterized protein n=1 Tax=Ceraceosorus bombacis TaxID=401625 RepID=A0A0N7LAE5_9BASI|nr:hypothetical protein CBOM_08017 [Ceraceosorus bombacis]
MYALACNRAWAVLNATPRSAPLPLDSDAYIPTNEGPAISLRKSGVSKLISYHYRSQGPSAFTRNRLASGRFTHIPHCCI